MEDLSNFIHEEIYMLRKESPINQESIEPQAKQTHRLAVITGVISEEESILLENILAALKLNDKDILRVSKVEPGRSDKWLLFAKSYQVESVSLEFYQPTKIGHISFVLAHPLSFLRESQEEKQNLWTSLKLLFGIEG